MLLLFFWFIVYFIQKSLLRFFPTFIHHAHWFLSPSRWFVCFSRSFLLRLSFLFFGSSFWMTTFCCSLSFVALSAFYSYCMSLFHSILSYLSLACPALCVCYEWEYSLSLGQFIPTSFIIWIHYFSLHEESIKKAFSALSMQNNSHLGVLDSFRWKSSRLEANMNKP